MATEQEKLAYELGCAIALAEYQGMTKEAFSPAAIAAISNAWKAGKGIAPGGQMHQNKLLHHMWSIAAHSLESCNGGIFRQII